MMPARHAGDCEFESRRLRFIFLAEKQLQKRKQLLIFFEENAEKYSPFLFFRKKYVIFTKKNK
jgi:hypothetical protein